MLLPADAAVVERDPALPGLATLLDPDAFAAALRTALPEAGVGLARATYVRYKSKTNCLVAYRLEVAGAEIDVYAKAFPADVEFLKTDQDPDIPGRLGPGRVALNNLAITVYAFPNDYKLGVLGRLADEEERAQLLTKLFAKRQPDFQDAMLHRLRYKPARRYVAQLTAGTGRQALLKVYSEDDYPTASYATKAFKSRGPLQLPRRMGRSTRHRILALEWLPGQPLHKAMHDPQFEVSVVRTAGAALAGLHTQVPKRLMHISREVEVVPLLSAAVGVATVCPHLAERACSLATRLAMGLLAAPRLNCPIHGDFSADQVLLTKGNVALVDLDHAVHSDPAADLGSFVAQLEYDALLGDLAPDRVGTLANELLTGYRLQTRRDLPARINLYVAAGLLRLAPHPFRYRHADWLEQTGIILERAEAIMKKAAY